MGSLDKASFFRWVSLFLSSMCLQPLAAGLLWVRPAGTQSTVVGIQILSKYRSVRAQCARSCCCCFFFLIVNSSFTSQLFYGRFFFRMSLSLFPRRRCIRIWQSVLYSTRPKSWSEAETKIRLDLARAHRLCAENGFDELTWNHISSRVPGVEDDHLITPGNRHFTMMEPMHLVWAESSELENVTANVIHGAIYQARDDVNAIVHCHSRACVFVSNLHSIICILFRNYEGRSLSLLLNSRSEISY